MEMLAYHARKLVMKILCCFIPSKRARLALRSKFGFGEKFVVLNEGDSFVPREVLAQIAQKSPLEFLALHREICQTQTQATKTSNACATADFSVRNPAFIAPPPNRIFT